MDWPAEKVLIHFLDIVERNLITPFTEAFRARRSGMAAIEVQTAQMRAIAETEIEIERLKTSRICISHDPTAASSPRALSPLSQANETISQNSDQVAASFSQDAVRSLRRDVNVARAVARAGSILVDECDALPSAEPDPDWLSRWRENASSVSAEKMQELWAQVLAREVRKPGSLSLRALDLLKNLDSQDAAKIEKLAPFVVNGVLVYRSPIPGGGNALPFSLALELQELGMLAGVGGAAMTVQLKSISTTSFFASALAPGYGLRIAGKSPSQFVSLPGYKVTSVGQEIMRLVSDDGNFDYVEELGVAVKQQGFDVNLVKITKTHGSEELSFEEIRSL